jgi:hypothetical protein
LSKRCVYDLFLSTLSCFIKIIGTVNTTNYTNPNGPVYLIDGSIGSPEGSDKLLQRSNDSCFLTSEPGFGILTIFDASHATYTFYRVSDMTILDQIHITKNR